MIDRFDLGIEPFDLYPVEEHSYWPQMRDACLQYDQTLRFLNIPPPFGSGSVWQPLGMPSGKSSVSFFLP